MENSEENATNEGSGEPNAPTNAAQDAPTNGVQDAAPDGVQDAAPDGVQDAAPDGVQDAAPAADNPQEAAVPVVNGDSFVSLNNQLNAQDLELMELKVKAICLEKNNMALKMELRCAELQMEAKAKIDTQKTRLVELLDGKVSSLTKRNSHLMDMMEGLLKEKDGRSQRLIDATKNMEDLAAKLAESEKMRSELRNVNLELKTMLGNIEDKGSQIAKMAKEKIMKYKEENEKMQQQLDEMKRGASGEMGAGNKEWAGRFQENWNKVDALQQQLGSALESGNADSSALATSKEIKVELEQFRAELNAFLDANQGQHDKLRSQLAEMKPQIAELHRLSQEYSVSTDQDTAQLKEQLNQLTSAITKLNEASSAQ